MPRSASTTMPTQSHLSREDIELLAGIKGGMEAVVAQINTLQASMQAESEARRLQMENQRSDHNEQIKLLKTQMEGLELWRVTTITEKRIKRWDDTAERVEKFEQGYKSIAWAWGIVVATFSIGGGWLLFEVIIPLLRGGK